MTDKPKVIFIMGYGHSGSTLLDIILGNQKNIASAGELFQFDPFFQGEDSRCSCGRPHSQCSFCREAADRFKVMAPWSNPAVLESLKRRYEVWRSIKCWYTLFRRSCDPSPQYLRYQSYLEAMYQAVFQASGSQIIVDSSKNPCRATALADLGSEIDCCFIHLVRDGRAVGWSMLKKKAREAGRLSKREQLQVFLRAMLGWILVNIQTEMAGKIIGSDRYLRIRYEDLVMDPKHLFSRIERLVGQPMNEPCQAIHSGAELHIGHLVAGNSMRMQDKVVFKPDIHWRDHLPPVFNRLYCLLGGWALKRYGYPVKQHAPKDNHPWGG